MANIRDITGKNRKFTGTTGIKLPEGTTAQRAGSPADGEIRFNSTTNLAEYYNGTDWKSIDTPPTITGFTLDGGSSVTSTVLDRTAGGTSSFVISGSNFDVTSATVVFEPESGGSNVSVASITRTNSSQFTVTATRADFLEANDPYAIKLTNGSGLAATLASALDVNVPPAFDQSSGTLATIINGDTLTTEVDCSATDTDGDTITYSITSGSLPGSGLSLNSSTGFVTGTLSGSPTPGDFAFTVQAATSKGNSTRSFTIAVTAIASGGTITSSGAFKVHTFTSSGTFTVPSGITLNNVEYVVIAGGAGGGSTSSGVGGAGGGGGAGGYRSSVQTENSGGGVSAETRLSLGAAGYTVTIGAGGAGDTNGTNSVFSTITSTGGGYGGSYQITRNGNSGGSGGGGRTGTGSNGDAGSGTSGQGRNGGQGGWVTGSYGTTGGGGGGGANTVGQAYSAVLRGADGGSGVATSISGSSVTYAVGGGGGGKPSGGSPFGAANSTAAGSATANSGGGGGASGDTSAASPAAGSGGSGRVIIKYNPGDST